MNTVQHVRHQRAKKTRIKIRKGLSNTPRLSIFRSNRSFAIQIIDDLTGKTLASAYMREINSEGTLSRKEQAEKLGTLIAQKAKKKNIVKVVFDRGRYAYHGHVKQAAEAARAEGLSF